MRIFHVSRYFLNEAISNLWANRFNNFVSIAIISFTLFAFGMFLLTAENLSSLIGKWTDAVQVNVFLAKNTSRDAASGLETAIKQSPCVAHYVFVSEEEAMRRFKVFYPGMKQLTDELETNPFPPSFEVTVRKEFQNKPAVMDLVNQLRGEKFVQDVEYDQDWIDRVQFVVEFIRIVGLFFGGILMFTATFSISNVIKLMVLSRRDEIEIMRLVGATNGFIKGPFLTEGILQGLVGGAIAVLLLFVMFTLIVQKLGGIQAPFFSADQLRFLTPWMSTAVIGGGMIVGFFGSLFSLTRLLRI
jgi:cell division transport system permease protein